MKEVTIAAVQMLSELGDIDQNARAMRGWVDRAAEEGAAFVFFPEGSLTGYIIEDPGDAVCPADDERALELERYAASKGVAIGYGFAERNPEGGRPYVSYVVSSENERLFYRKTHLGSQECNFYEAGDELPVAQVNGVSIGIQMCWEGHIPDIATTLRAKGAELLVMPHAGGLAGARRLDSWSRYLPARAFDNGMYLVACNALRYGMSVTGRDIEGHSSHDDDGALAVYAPDGKLVVSYHGTDAHMVVAAIGGALPRDHATKGKMVASYFDRRRPELYA